MQRTALDGWRDYTNTLDDAALRLLLHPDAVFESPILHTPQRGREITLKYLTGAGKVMSGHCFRFVGEWCNDSGAVLEFENVIEGIRLNGVDIITFDQEGSLITHFKVMIRPLKAIALLGRLMAEQLARA